MNLSKNALILAITLAALSPVKGGRADTGANHPNMETVEVLLGQVFIPAIGYGTNNNVQLTLDGYLPNSCYQLGTAKVEVGSDPHTLIVHQYADLQSNGICADLKNLPPQLTSIVPFTYDVNVGHLEAGSYQVVFNKMSPMGPQTRTFSVYQSKNMTADDFPYAAVSTVSMPDVVNGLYPVSVVISGTLTSTCAYLADVKVTPEDDVIVVQPILGIKKDVLCGQIMVPFSKSVNLGKLFEGRYLVHVRSMSGKSVSHAFSVVMPDPSVK